MKIFIASDHAGFKCKEQLIKMIQDNSRYLGINDIIDLGTYNDNCCDYPDYAKKLVIKLKKNISKIETDKQENFGVLICGTGIGMCMVANRFKRIRAVACNDVFDAEMARKHNNANILCIGARKITNNKTVFLIFSKFIKTEYEGGRHDNRIKKF